MKPRQNPQTNWCNFFADYNVRYEPCSHTTHVSKDSNGIYEIKEDITAQKLTGFVDDIISAYSAMDEDMRAEFIADMNKKNYIQTPLSNDDINNLIVEFENENNKSKPEESVACHCCNIF